MGNTIPRLEGGDKKEAERKYLWQVKDDLSTFNMPLYLFFSNTGSEGLNPNLWNMTSPTAGINSLYDWVGMHLRIAAEKGYTSVIEYLLPKNPVTRSRVINHRGEDGWNPVEIAAMEPNNLDVVRLLIDNGASGVFTQVTIDRGEEMEQYLDMLNQENYKYMDELDSDEEDELDSDEEDEDEDEDEEFDAHEERIPFTHTQI